MRFVSLAAVLSIATLSVLVGCAADTSDSTASDEGAVKAPAPGADVVIDKNDDGKTIAVELGDTFVIQVVDNGGSTGFRWAVKSVDRTLGQPVITTESNPSGPVGSGSLKKFTWSTTSPLSLVGKHVITLENARGSTVGNTLTVTVDIQSATTPTKPAMCGGLAGLKCGKGEFCDYTTKAACGKGDQSGKCVVAGTFCAAVVTPVCGCDGKTYNNSCEANVAGTDTLAAGACGKPKK